jgi:hypothetical protein|tara:strand:+ start:892 stop:1071 length:180 start_codon:yes stop_codon:yes gene_type:complete
MAKMEQVGGMMYIGSAPESETIPEHDSQVDLSQTIGNAVLAGPITFAATITITGTVVIV